MFRFRCVGVIDTEDTRLNCKHLVINASQLPPEMRHKQQQQHQSRVARAVFLTDQSIHCETPPREDLTLLSLSRSDGQEPVRVLELGPATYACPKGMFLVHMTTSCSSRDSHQDEETIFKDAVDQLFCSTHLGVFH